MKYLNRLFKPGKLVLLGCILFVSSNVEAGLNQNCTVNILNRTIQVQQNGSWAMPNVPSSMGQVRARATCTENGVTTSGPTDYFSLITNRNNRRCYDELRIRLRSERKVIPR